MRWAARSVMPDPVGDVAHPDLGVAGNAEQDRRVVRHEGPGPGF